MVAIRARGLRFRPVALSRCRSSSATQGAPRAKMSVRTMLASVQCFVWVHCMSLRRAIRRPSSTSRYPSSMSSMPGFLKPGSKPPTASKAARRMAPQPLQKVEACSGLC